MAIRNDKGKFIVDVSRTIEGTKRRVFGGSYVNYEEAKAKEAMLIAELLSGHIPKPKRKTKNPENKITTLDELFVVVFEKYYRGTPSEAKSFSIGNEVLDILNGKTNLHNLTHETAERLVENFESQGNKPSTVKRKLTVFSKMMTYAFTRQLIATKPVVEYSGNDSVEYTRFLTEAEEAALKRMMPERYKNLVTCLIQTGCRYSELINLKQSDIRGNKVFFKDRKNKKTTLVPISKEVQKILAEDLFDDIQYSDFIREWNKVRIELGLSNDPAFTPHICRHTAASRLIANGVDLIYVQRLLGHTTIKTTADSYGHLCDTGMEDKLAASLW